MAMATDQATDVLGQLNDCFGSVLQGKRGSDPSNPPQTGDRPPKVGRGQLALGGRGKGFQGGGKGNRRAQRRTQNRQQWSGSSNSSYPDGSTEDGEDSELLHLVAKAVIRHTDTLNVLRRSTGWVFWAKSGDNSILPMLADLARKWHEVATKQEISSTRLSLRVTLLWGILTCLKDKVANLTQEQMAYAARSSWADATGNWNYQKWDAHHQALIVDTTRPPLSQTQILESLATLLKVINGDTLTRFAATQEIKADAQGTITFQADISLRAPGSEELYNELVRLHGLAIFQIIGLQFRQEGYNRPPLIRRIQQLLG